MRNTFFLYKKTNRLVIYSVNCFIGGGEENRIVSQFMYEYKIKRQYINFPLTNS